MLRKRKFCFLFLICCNINIYHSTHGWRLAGWIENVMFCYIALHKLEFTACIRKLAYRMIITTILFMTHLHKYHKHSRSWRMWNVLIGNRLLMYDAPLFFDWVINNFTIVQLCIIFLVNSSTIWILNKWNKNKIFNIITLPSRESNVLTEVFFRMT